jgi:glycosyltransferase involved in cell wall biosynthesis
MTSLAIIIPALDEEAAIGRVLQRLPYPADWVTVADNGSTDATAAVAIAAGARVVHEPQRGYGRACLAGLRVNRDRDIIVFLDADFSEDPAEITGLIDPIRDGDADLVLGWRPVGGRPWHARLGTSLCVGLINRLWGVGYRDLGPFRAIRRSSLDRLGMTDQTWGWTIEMQVKAVEHELRWLEVPVLCRPRIGQSKISGTLAGTVRAGTRMLYTIYDLWRRRRATQDRRRATDGARAVRR